MENNATKNAILQRTNSENMYIPAEYNNLLAEKVKKRDQLGELGLSGGQ
jgi:hypothetical protein